MLKSSVKSLLVKLGLRQPQPAHDIDVDQDLDQPMSAEQVITELGLVEDAKPVRDYPWWRKPERILVTEVSPRRLAWLQEAAPDVQLVSVRWHGDTASAASAVDAIIGWCTADMIAAAKNLRWLQLGATGVEKILQIDGLQNRDLLITNMQRTSGPMIAEHTFAMLLCLTRGLHRYRDAQKRHTWTQSSTNPHDLLSLQGRTLLVAGIGGIGTEIARHGHHFGMRVLATRASQKPAPAFVSRLAHNDALGELAGEADVIVNALPDTAATRHIFNHQLFAAAKRGAIFINIARGTSVVTDDLMAALRSGRIAAAGLDVTDPEPLPGKHPLWRMENVIITPHLAGWGGATRAREWAVMKENLRRYASGEPLLSVVDPARGY